jgi:hypothetical protein
MADSEVWADPKVQDLMDLGINFRRAQFLGGGAVRVARSRIHPHLGPLPQEQLDLAAEKCPQKVHLGQPLLSQLLKGLAQGLQLAEVLPSHSISPRWQGSRAAIGKRVEWSRHIIPQVKQLFCHPFINLGMGISR